MPLLERLDELQRRWIEDSTHGRSHMYSFAAETVDLDISTPNATGGLVSVMERIERIPGVRLHKLKQDRFRWKGARHAFSQRRQNQWRWAMAVTGLPNDLTVLPSRAIQASGVQYVGCHRLEIDSLSNESCAALYSSLMRSSGLQELVIKEPSELHWHWLFYALFDEGASLSVTSLVIIDTDISLDDVIPVREMIRLRQPSTMLTESKYEAFIVDAPPVTRRPDSSPLPANVTLHDGAYIHLDPRMNSKGRVQTSRSRTFDVMHGRNEGLDILVPGYGQCWVAHNDVASKVPLSEDSPLANRWNFKAHSISKLSISLKEAHLADIERGVRVLLRLVGTPVTHLSIAYNSVVLELSPS